MATIRVSDPVDLVKVLPYQLGYHPTDSLALVGLRGRHLGLVQRADLPGRPGELAGLVEHMHANLRRDRCAAAVVIVYESERDVGAEAGRELARRLREDGIAVSEHVVVRDGRLYFPESPIAGLGDDGVTLPQDCDVPAVADFVALGCNPSPTRNALSMRVAADDGPLTRRVRTAADRLDWLVPQTLHARAMADWGRLLDVTGPQVGPVPSSAAAAARMGVSLLDVQLRDLLTAWLCPGTLSLEVFAPRLVALARSHLPALTDWDEPDAQRRDPEGVSPSEPGADAGSAVTLAHGVQAVETSNAVIERLCWLARHTPTPLAPGVLTVLGSYAWWLGDGPLASVALERALAINPAYRLARLVERMVTMAMRPLCSA